MKGREDKNIARLQTKKTVTVASCILNSFFLSPLLIILKNNPVKNVKIAGIKKEKNNLFPSFMRAKKEIASINRDKPIVMFPTFLKIALYLKIRNSRYEDTFSPSILKHLPLRQLYL